MILLNNLCATALELSNNDNSGLSIRCDHLAERINRSTLESPGYMVPGSTLMSSFEDINFRYCSTAIDIILNDMGQTCVRNGLLRDATDANDSLISYIRSYNNISIVRIDCLFGAMAQPSFRIILIQETVDADAVYGTVIRNI